MPQPDGKVLVGGLVTGLVRLNADGTKDTAFNVYPVYSTFAQPFVVTSKAAIQPDGKILIAGVFNKVNDNPRNGLARLNPDGSLDSSFDVTVDFDKSGLTPAAAIAVQPDNKILVAGKFTTVNGAAHNSLVRLNPNGTLDSGFTPPTSGGSSEQVLTLVLAASNKILIGGSFKSLNNAPREAIARLDTSGAVDSSFTAYQIVTSNLVDGEVRTFAIQYDGKVLLSGNFTQIAGQTRPGLARLNLDGLLDSSFQPTGNYAPLYIGIQPSGKILLVTHNGDIVRLNADGSLDNGFPTLTSLALYSFAIQPDGKFLVGSSNDASRLARYSENGFLDNTFNAQIEGANPNYHFYYRVTAITLQPDGKVLIGGVFDSVSGQPRHYLARLNADGSLDTSFAPSQNTSGSVGKLVAQPDGKVWVGGDALIINTSKNLVRLNSDGSLDSSFVAPNLLYLTDFVVQPDGKAIVSYQQTFEVGAPSYFKRLTLTGAVDSSFEANPDNKVQVIGLYSNGKVLIGGQFLSVNNTRRNYLARLLNDVSSGLASQLTLSSSNLMANPGDSLVLTATLSQAVASGNVTFSEGANVLATVPVANGVAGYFTSTLGSGLHKITASYSGDADFAPSTSAVLFQRIIQACGSGVSPLVITLATDDGSATLCGTLSFALGQTGKINTLPHVTVNLPDGGRTITFNGELSIAVAANLRLDGGACGSPALLIKGNNVAGAGLRLSGNNSLRNVQISGFAGSAIITKGFSNRFECVQVLGS